ncbi:hypothetical protein [Desulfonema magnum]|uniref:Uncharacterized protein n=1 Tax=Desulfonema magnum TaxID=45655 RepID=A0A975GU13_9BACT|nr:hypothetical protein [Desulfonema magnum]QTA93674.1 Uncharacterized protein dnm_097780 [Desulfonema magnum]
MKKTEVTKVKRLKVSTDIKGGITVPEYEGPRRTGRVCDIVNGEAVNCRKP